MSSYLGQCWRCDSCEEIDNAEPWLCPNCDKEVCENCFWEYMHCKECAEKESNKEILRQKAESIYMVIFDDDDLSILYNSVE